ncbi:tol-pal system protein YbgF [Candidatus Palibaumannia cicadellinicola]|uniref:Cell division coordinator CpoB n=1 Tax=Candidatus Palibaumannia cicadellinicola TaxID=186490 RepID=A0A2N4XXB3_9GAMM|nr:tol-pal system protein YbgF [Candidatus Baumannia cicadellinicola]PLK58944.1 tol-pal system protein YbgF [Candidatus Baumannia cicadellinicola]
MSRQLISFILLILMNVTTSWSATFIAPVSDIGSRSEDLVVQLEHIYNVHSKLIIQLQQQLTENQHDIDVLRGQIQENKYQLDQLSFQGRNSTIVTSISPSNSSHVNIDYNDYNTINTDYNAAVALVLHNQPYHLAYHAFQNFINNYPDSTYLPNANYWLGLLNYNNSRKEEAAYYFAHVVKNYPLSPKTPDALLKVGIIMQEKGQKDKAKAVYHNICKRYPSANAAKQAQKYLANL